MAEKDFVVKNGLVVNTNLIVADGDLNRVGINNTTPDATLSVTGTANVSGNITTLSTIRTANLAVGDNVVVNSTTMFVGNSTSNSTQTSEFLRITNSTSTANLTSVDLKIGISTLNSTAFSIGSDVSVNSSTIYVGNSTTNTVVNSSAFSVTNSSSGVSVTPSSISVGNSSVNVQISLSSGISGNGVGVTSLNATSITSGTLPGARLSGAYTGITQTGTLSGIAVTGNSNFDSGVLFVDGVNNRVGINNTQPGSALTVAGNTYIEGTISVNGNFIVTGNLVTAGPQEFSGDLTPQFSDINLGNTTNRWEFFGTTGNFSGNVVFGSNLIINTTSISYIGNTTTSPTIVIANTGSVSIGNSSTTQTGSIVTVANSSGSVQISPAGISGNGINITSVNATNITVGTLPGARLSGAYTGITQTGTLTGLVVTGNVNIDSGVLFVDGVNNRVGVNTSSPSVSLQVASNDAILVPIGNTANRPTAANGMIRYNVETNSFEGHANGSWGSVAPPGGGYYRGNRGAIGDVLSKQNLFRINANTQSNNITIFAGENALAVGPITVDVGYTLVVEEGGRAVII